MKLIDDSRIWYFNSLKFILPSTKPNGGIIISFTGAALWFATDMLLIQKFSNQIIPFLNAAFRLTGFLITTYIVSELKNALDKQKELAGTDPLTSISNKRSFYEQCEMELNKSRRYDSPFSIICIDLDNFKEINDNYGHHTGDVLLKTVSGLIKENIRGIDLTGRLGGDEFGILLTGSGADPAYTVANKLQRILLDEMKKNGWSVTCSMGVATFLYPPENVDEMLKRADVLMYTAKKNGKNMIKHLVISK